MHVDGVAGSVPRIQITPPTEEVDQDSDPRPLSTPCAVVDGDYCPTPDISTPHDESTCSPHSYDIMRSSKEGAIKIEMSPPPGVRRSTRSSQKIKSYRDPYDSDDCSSDGRSVTPSPRGSKRKLEPEIDELDDSEDEPPPVRRRKGSSRPTRRRKVMNLACGVPGCNQTFGRENDRKRHWRTASIHEAERPRLLQEHNLAQELLSCERCGESLSRNDARIRHMRDQSCGKRAGRKKGKANTGVTTEQES